MIDDDNYDDDLFSYPHRPGAVRGSDTSEAAGESIRDRELSRMRLAVFNLVKGRGPFGATCDETEVELAMRHQTASARIRELVLLGWLKDSERRRLTRSSRYARVYIISETCHDSSPHSAAAS